MLDTIISGGWMMIFLMACSLIALAVVLDRAYAFKKYSQINNRALRAQVLEYLLEGRIEEAATLCANTPGPVSAVLLTGLQSYARHKAHNKRPESLIAIMEKAMEDYSSHALSAVEKRLGVLQTVGNAAPLLGMTGTVIGMIQSFEGLAAEGGDSAAVAKGIAVALITTAAGLLIALLAVIPYNVFTAYSDAIELEVEEASSELLDFIATRVETANEQVEEVLATR